MGTRGVPGDLQRPGPRPLGPRGAWGVGGGALREAAVEAESQGEEGSVQIHEAFKARILKSFLFSQRRK